MSTFASLSVQPSKTYYFPLWQVLLHDTFPALSLYNGALSFSPTTWTHQMNSDSPIYGVILSQDGHSNITGFQYPIGFRFSLGWLPGAHSEGQLALNGLLPAWSKDTVPPSGWRMYCSLHLPTSSMGHLKIVGGKGFTSALLLHLLIMDL